MLVVWNPVPSPPTSPVPTQHHAYCLLPLPVPLILLLCGPRDGGNLALLPTAIAIAIATAIVYLERQWQPCLIATAIAIDTASAIATSLAFAIATVMALVVNAQRSSKTFQHA